MEVKTSATCNGIDEICFDARGICLNGTCICSLAFTQQGDGVYFSYCSVHRNSALGLYAAVFIIWFANIFLSLISLFLLKVKKPIVALSKSQRPIEKLEIYTFVLIFLSSFCFILYSIIIFSYPLGEAFVGIQLVNTFFFIFGFLFIISSILIIPLQSSAFYFIPNVKKVYSKLIWFLFFSYSLFTFIFLPIYFLKSYLFLQIVFVGSFFFPRFVLFLTFLLSAWLVFYFIHSFPFLPTCFFKISSRRE